MKFLVIKIKHDYVYEKSPVGNIAMDTVILRNGNGEELTVQVPDRDLYEKDIREGDWIQFDVNDVIYKEK